MAALSTLGRASGYPHHFSGLLFEPLRRLTPPSASVAAALGWRLDRGALAFYGRLFTFELRAKSDSMAFIDLGDQFIALQEGHKQPADDSRHFGLVVDDKVAARRALDAAGVASTDGPFLDFRDPWGNRIEIVGYETSNLPRPPMCCVVWV